MTDVESVLQQLAEKLAVNFPIIHYSCAGEYEQKFKAKTEQILSIVRPALEPILARSESFHEVVISRNKAVERAEAAEQGLSEARADLESGFMVGAYARLKHLQNAEDENSKLLELLRRIRPFIESGTVCHGPCEHDICGIVREIDALSTPATTAQVICEDCRMPMPHAATSSCIRNMAP